jgi:NAD(P)-dependent dehydrogenase (short-subunit alcohol dehydrogenase family)
MTPHRADPDSLPLAGRVALVTGGGQGIGRAIAVRLADGGADIVILERKAETISEAVAAVEAAGRRALGLTVDIAEADGVNEAVAAALDRFDRVDILVNNAAAHRLAKVYDLSVADWDRMIAVCLSGAFYVTRAVLPGMRAAGWGRIVNISSSAATRTGATVVYGVAKLALERLTIGLAHELAESGISANAIRLNHAVDTPTARTWFGRADPSWWPPEAMAETVWHIVRQDAAFTGRIVAVEDLASSVPAVARLIAPTAAT